MTGRRPRDSGEPSRAGGTVCRRLTDRRPFTILLADDDEEDRELARDALQDSRLANEMKFVVDGQDLLDYLRHEGRWAGPDVDAPRPGIILLDLNMPKKDGREALAEIKADEALRRIPIVVLTTSSRRGRHPVELRPRRQLVHHQAGHVRRAGRCDALVDAVLVRDRPDPER